MQVDVPLGFQFMPSDEEVVKGYHVRQIRGQELSWNGIQFYDLYGKSPCKIFHGTDHELSEEDDYKFHVFTRLKKASLHRVSRVDGCGTWHEDKKSEKIFADKKKKMGLTGLKKNFTFRIKNGSKKSHWIMHEISLAGDGDSRSVLDVFFLGKALSEALNEWEELAVGEFLSVVGRLQAGQQKQVHEF